MKVFRVTVNESFTARVCVWCMGCGGIVVLSGCIGIGPERGGTRGDSVDEPLGHVLK